MFALPLLLTHEGWEAFTAAQLSQDIDLAIASIGLTSATFVMSPTLTALPGEFKRIEELSGKQVGTDLVHLTVTDSSSDTYDVRGFGLFLADGRLFGVYGQAEPIVEKASAAAMLLACDIKFLEALVANITFGATGFLYPPATTTEKGVAEIATQAEVDAGVDAQRIVTPQTLAARLLQALGDRLSNTRQILTGGLATGGGDLTADRTVTVPAASAAETDAGALATKAVTPAGLANVLAKIAALLGRNIQTGGLATGGGDLGADRTITVPAATAAETDAGLLAVKAVTPASLINVLSSITARALRTRVIGTGGLATGGGDLTGDRTITVPKASQAEVTAGTDDTKAVTPYALQGLGATANNAVPKTRQILVAGLATGGGDLSADRTITVPKATAAETNAGTDDTKVVTPFSLSGFIANLNTLFGRTITATGLATGGGSLASNRTIDVPKASSAEILAGTVDTKAITPLGAWSFIRSVVAAGYVQIPFTPIILQWGSGSAIGNGASSVTLPLTFPNACFFAVASGGNPDNDASHNGPWVSGRSTASLSIFNSLDGTTSFTFFAIGY
ncbi:MAG TPA: hypothetical protein VF680_01435 [Allosphingosinicella sp.]|jgi:hypothetical protein